MISSSEFRNRRKNLVRKCLEDRIPKLQKSQTRSYVFIVSASFETAELSLFEQEPQFFYLTGLTVPGLVWVLEFEVQVLVHSSHTITWKILHQNEWLFKPFFKPFLSIPSWAEELNRNQWRDFKIQSPSSPPSSVLNPISYLAVSIPFDYYQPLLDFVTSRSPTIELFWNDEHSFLSHVFIQRIKSQFPSLSTHSSSLSEYISELRQEKSDYELKYLHTATNITVEAHNQAFRALAEKTCTSDWALQAIFQSHFVRRGCRLAYEPIVLVGSKAKQLHGVADGSLLKDGQLVLMDVAASYQGYHTDITRTLPISGKFTPDQRKYYDLVVNQLDYVASQITPGRSIYKTTSHFPSLQALSEKFIRKNPTLRSEEKVRFLQHGIGHHIGLETHDPDPRPLQAGNIIALETGYYSDEYSIRVENIYLVRATESAHLLSLIPYRAEQIEENFARLRIPPQDREK
jgi:Xaa-Pro aminopeptidase